MDWLKDEIERAWARSPARPATISLCEWIDDSLRDGDEWIDNRLKDRIAELGERSLREWTAEEANAGRQPAPKDVEKRRARIQAELRDPTKTAQARAEVAKEYVDAQKHAAQHRSTSGANDERILGWIGQQLAGDSDRDWLDKDGPEWSLKKAGGKFQHYVNLALRQWLAGAGRGGPPTAAGGRRGTAHPAVRQCTS